jgi:lipopolysaccharide export system protein LptA
MMRRIGVALAAGLALALATTAAAQQADLAESVQHDTSLPIAISADAMEVEQEAQRAIFLGAVDVEQGDLVLKAERLVVYYRDKQAEEDNAIYKIEVDGNVRFATPNETAQGDSGVYNVDEGTIRLVGNVVLTSGQSVIRGSEAVMNLETGKSEVLSESEGGRVEGLFIPDKSGQTESTATETP